MVVARRLRRNRDAVEDGARRYNSNVRVLSIDSLEEHGEPILLIRLPTCGPTSKPIFVSDLNVVDRPWLRIPERRPESAVLACHWPGEELNFIQRKVDKLLQLVLWGDISVQSEAVPDSQD